MPNTPSEPPEKKDVDSKRDSSGDSGDPSALKKESAGQTTSTESTTPNELELDTSLLDGHVRITEEEAETLRRLAMFQKPETLKMFNRHVDLWKQRGAPQNIKELAETGTEASNSGHDQIKFQCMLQLGQFIASLDEPPPQELFGRNISDAATDSATEATDDAMVKGWVKITDEEKKALIALAEVLPKSHQPGLKVLAESAERHGIPLQMKELIHKHMQTGLSFMDIAKLGSIYIEVTNLPENEKSKLHDFFKKRRGMFSMNQPPSSGSGEESGDKGQSNKNNGKGTPPKQPDWRISVAILGFIAIFALFNDPSKGREITWQEFRTKYLEKGLVQRLVVSGDIVKVILNHETAQETVGSDVNLGPMHFSVGSRDSFERKIEQAQNELGIPPSEQIPISYERPSVIGGLIMGFAPTLLLVGLLVWVSRRGVGGGAGGNPFKFGKSLAKPYTHESAVKVKFADVAGADEAKLEIVEFVSFLKTPEKFVRLGAKIPRGAILSGPPGTGKTLLAKATAGESGVPFFSVSGSEFVEMFVGVGASRVRDLFKEARKHAPCIIFIDEIDAIGKSRDSGSRFGGNDEREATLNQILTEMDGFNTNEQVVVLAGTNRPEILDKALMRPGRFDRHIHIDRPTMKGRAEIFRVHLARILTKEDLEYLCGRLSALTPGFAGADIANVVNEAALVAARDDAESVTMVHFERAIERVIGGLERKSLVLGPEEKRTVAYHEAGHAVCGWYFQWADPLLKVSIIPRGSGALGYAQYLPAGDAYLMNVNQLMDRMAMTLGGRVSEQLHFPTVTTGASDDFKKVTQMATTMVTQWGMSERLGPLHFSQDPNQVQKPFAESTAQIIDAEVRRIVDKAYTQCLDLLTEKKAQVGIVAEELLRREQLTRDDIIRLLGPREWPDKEEFSKYFDGTKDSNAPIPTGKKLGEVPPIGGLGDKQGPMQPTVFKAIEDRR